MGPSILQLIPGAAIHIFRHERIPPAYRHVDDRTIRRRTLHPIVAYDQFRVDDCDSLRQRGDTDERTVKDIALIAVPRSVEVAEQRPANDQGRRNSCRTSISDEKLRIP